MKRKAIKGALTVIMLIAVGITGLATMQIFANNPIRVQIAGEFVDFEGQPPINRGGRILVPIRGVFTLMGFEPSWDGATSTATLSDGTTLIVIPVGQPTFTVDGRIITPDVPAINYNGRVLIPLRAITEAIDGTAEWLSGINTAVITPPPELMQVVLTSLAQTEEDATPEPPAVARPSREEPFAYTASSITLPNRRLTDAERQVWIDEYNANGGPSAFELEVVRLVNLERANYGLNPLEICPILMQASRFYAQTMANLNTTLGHREGPYGGSGATADAFGDRMINVRAQNGIAGHWTPESAVQGWMNSPGHRDNILRPNVTRMGTGFYLGGQWGVFGYQIFGGGVSPYFD